MIPKESGTADDGPAKGDLAYNPSTDHSAASQSSQDQFDNIPHELRAYRAWCVWRYEKPKGEGRLTKVPYNPLTRKHVSSTDPNTWCDYATCVDAARANKGWHGIGFVLSPNDPYCFIDLDPTKDKDGNLLHLPDVTARQTEIYKAANSYSELSPSGAGLHIFVRGHVETGRKRDFIEIYSEARFATFTGDVYPRGSQPAEIRPAQDLCDHIWQSLAKANAADEASVDMSVPAHEDDDAVLFKASTARNGAKFSRVRSGDTSDYRNDNSSADMAFCRMLAFYTPSAEQIDRLWLTSPIGRRHKAQSRKKYRYDTIRKALASAAAERAAEKASAQAAGAIFEEAMSNYLPTPQSPSAGAVGANFSPLLHHSNVVGWNAFMEDSEPPFYVVQRMLQAGSLYAFTASWGAGKTAVGLTMAMHVAAGIPLNTIKVSRSKVLYLCGENPGDVKLRARAAAARFNIDWNMLQGWIHFTKRPFAIDNAQQLNAFVTEAAQYGPFGLVIVDTGPAHSEAEDENDNRQMHKLAMALRHLMAPFADAQSNRAPAIMVLMHPAKSAKRDEITARGGGAFLGSIDGEILGWRADPKDPVEVYHRTKFRGPGFDPLLFNLEPFTFSQVTDNFGEPIKTVIAVLTNDKPAQRTAVTGAARVALDALKTCGFNGSATPPNDIILREHIVFPPTRVVHEDHWRARCYETGISDGDAGAKKTAFRRARKKLVEDGLVHTFNDHYWLHEWVAPGAASAQPTSGNLL